MTNLRQSELLAGIAMLAATLARYTKMSAEEQQALGNAWLRVFYPRIKSREQWDKTLDILLSTETKFPTPQIVNDVLDMNSAAGQPRSLSRGGPTWRGGEPQATAVELWVRNNPRKPSEGALEYIDRIAFETGLIPARVIGTSDAVKGLEGTAGILGRLRGDQVSCFLKASRRRSRPTRRGTMGGTRRSRRRPEKRQAIRPTTEKQGG